MPGAPMFFLPQRIQWYEQVQRTKPGAKGFIVAPWCDFCPAIQLYPPEHRNGGEGVVQGECGKGAIHQHHFVRQGALLQRQRHYLALRIQFSNDLRS